MGDDGLDAQFKDILRRKNERDAKARAETKAWRDEAQQQLTDFQKVRDGAIVPALEDVSAVARSNGQDGVRLKVHDGGERIEFYWEPPHPPNPTRLKFTWDSRKPAEISVSGPDGEQEMRLSDVNREGVRAMAMGYLDACMVGSDERK